ncbi:2'-5' RNA ligase family protein, partial [Pseudomonas aeruginosa]|uniref:2'-5' RNA ligase family protein n=1 Tax=Pseudomonas aeruginosa TaxID=287 RepID=UPI000AA05AFF
MATANLHLTLAFLGQVPSARREALLDMAAAIEAAPLDLYLDRLLRWRNGLLLLAPSPVPYTHLTPPTEGTRSSSGYAC